MDNLQALGAGTRALIDLEALSHNLQQIHSRLQSSAKIWAMIKSNGYGHGSVRVSQALAQADAFGVASVEEAIALRESKISQPIVVMSRFYTVNEIKQIAAHQLGVIIHHLHQVQMLEHTRLTQPVMIWLKFRTPARRSRSPGNSCSAKTARPNWRSPTTPY